MSFFKVSVNVHGNHVIETCVYLFWGFVWVDVFDDNVALYVYGRKFSKKLRQIKTTKRMSVDGTAHGEWREFGLT